MTWQPIETAPRDGTRVLLIIDRRCEIGSYDITETLHNGLPTSRREGWNIGRPLWSSFIEPVAWMHLPAVPKLALA